LPRLELAREDVLDLRRDVADQAGERPGGRRDWRVADEDAEAVGLFLDVNKEGESGLLEQLTGVAARQRAGHAAEDTFHLAVDHDCVQTLFAAEVLVDDRLGNAGAGGKLLDRRRFEASFGEEL